MTFAVKTTVNHNPKSDTRESPELLQCIQDTNAGAWLGYLRLKKLNKWLQTVEIDIDMADDGTQPTLFTISVMIIPPAAPEPYKHQFSSNLPGVKQRKDYFRDWVASLIVDGVRHYARRVHYSDKKKLQELEDLML